VNFKALPINHWFFFSNTVDCTLVHDKLRADERDLRVSNICQPLKFTKESARFQEYDPVLTYFGVEQKILMCAREMPCFMKSDTFQRLLKDRKKDVQDERKKEKGSTAFTFSAVVDDIWLPVTKKFMDMCHQLKNGNITFSQTKKYFGIYKDKYDKLKEELLEMCRSAKLDNNWVARRTYQVEQYHCLHRYRSGAEVMVRLKKTFDLEGNFGKLDILLSAVSLQNVLIHSL
jgi:hypothetical protein